MLRKEKVITMEREKQEAWELAKQLVQIDSSDPGAYEEEIGLWITDWFKKQIADFGGQLADQIHVSRLEVLPGRYNVMAKIPGKTEGPGLIYICHMDTVMLGDGWDEDISPLGAMIRDGKMYGRGACDMKSGLACALTAFKNMVKKVGERGELPEKPFSMICSVDEEDFMRGVEAAIKAGWVTKNDWILDTENMTVASRMTISNMAIEAGAKCALFTPDEKTAEYCDITLNDYQTSLAGDADANYCKVMEYKAEDFVPVMACPSQVDKIRNVSELEGTEIDQVFIGSCTNGRLEDLAAAAEVLKGKKVADFVKLIVTPASRKIYRQADEMGILDTLAEAGAIITHPGCGLCCGRTGGILTDGERVVATNNRNFLGRMGTSKVQIYLASPKTAASCAVAGKIVSPQ